MRRREIIPIAIQKTLAVAWILWVSRTLVAVQLELEDLKKVSYGVAQKEYPKLFPTDHPHPLLAAPFFSLPATPVPDGEEHPSDKDRK